MGYSVEYQDVAYVEKENDSMNIVIDNTIFKNSWEGYHSEIISSGETQTPSKEICDNLELFLEPQTSDLYNKSGELISTTFKFGTGYNSTSVFTYIRKSYLEEYLKGKKKKIIWLKWSEKRYFPGGIQKSVSSEEREYRTFYEIIL